MVQNFVRVRQEYKHIIVKGAGGLRGETGPQGPEGPAGPQGPQGATGIQGEQGVQGIQGPKGDPGAGLVITGSVNTYADLPNYLGPDDAGKAFFVQADGKLYVWSGTAWPADGEGSQFEGPQGPQGVQGPQGIQGPQGEPGADANVVNTLSQSITDAYSAKYINDNNYTKTETDTLLAAKAPANEVAYIGQEVAGGSTLIGTSDIAPGAITTSKVADGAITSDKIDSATLFQDISSQFTWVENSPLKAEAWLIASKFVLINYMGGDTTHAPGQRIANIPSGYRPAYNLWEIANYAGSPGNVVVGANGELNCNSVGSQSQGRVLFSVLYPIA